MAVNVKIGDRVEKYPYAINEGWEHKKLEGRVMWIHPAGRFYVVEFRLPGGAFCESFRE